MWGFLAALISGALMSIQGVFNTETEQPVGIDGLGAVLGFCSLRCRVAFYRAAERFCVMAGGE